jgi:hypothetical protein
MRKACYASAVVLVLGASPLVLALPAAADHCGPAGLLPSKFCPAPPTPGPSTSPTPSPTVPGNPAEPPSGAPPKAPPQAPSQRPSPTPSQGQPAQPAQVTAPPTSGPVPTSDQDNAAQPATESVPPTVTTGTSAPPAADAGQDPEPSTGQPLGGAAGQGDSGPDGQFGVAGSLLAISGLLIGLSAAIGLRRPAQH